jgi:hypothetical protein
MKKKPNHLGGPARHCPAAAARTDAPRRRRGAIMEIQYGIRRERARVRTDDFFGRRFDFLLAMKRVWRRYTVVHCRYTVVTLSLQTPAWWCGGHRGVHIAARPASICTILPMPFTRTPAPSSRTCMPPPARRGLLLLPAARRRLSRGPGDRGPGARAPSPAPRHGESAREDSSTAGASPPRRCSGTTKYCPPRHRHRHAF